VTVVYKSLVAKTMCYINRTSTTNISTRQVSTTNWSMSTPQPPMYCGYCLIQFLL